MNLWDACSILRSQNFCGLVQVWAWQIQAYQDNKKNAHEIQMLYLNNSLVSMMLKKKKKYSESDIISKTT